MNLDLNILQDKLCGLMCAEVKVRKKNDTLLVVETPFYFSDGDPYQIYIKEMPGGVMRLTDAGHTMMHLSYENDVDKFFKDGTRNALFQGILSEHDVTYISGQFYIDTKLEDLGSNIFKFGQALTRITDLTFLNRARVESTFYDDLNDHLIKVVPNNKLHKDYIIQTIENGRDYPIDFFIDAPKEPLYLFGISGRDKARLTTIILERLLREQVKFSSLLVFQKQEEISRADMARLSNVGGEMIASLSALDDLDRKIMKRMELN